MDRINNLRGKNILVTGSTGFKGSWLCMWLKKLGASVHGLALPSKYPTGNFNICNLDKHIDQIYSDVRIHIDTLKVLSDIKPDLVFHMAAQPLVLESYEDPYTTYHTNILGTVNVLDACRVTPSVKSIVVVTTDKCYHNSGEVLNSFLETDKLGGDDPYSSSKACAELVAHAYYKSFFSKSGVGVSTARAGNVVGGGDRSRDRIVPDIIRSIEDEKNIFIRNPGHVRPWQYVLEPLYGYMALASKMLDDPSEYSSGWNFGPKSESFATVQDFTEKIVSSLPSVGVFSATKIELGDGETKKEKKLLALNSDKAERLLGVHNLMNMNVVARMVVEDYFMDMDPFDKCNARIEWYEDLIRKAGK